MPKHIKSFLELRFLASLTFSSYNSMCFLTRFLTHLLFSQKFCFRNSVVQFSRIDARKVISLRQLCYYITPKPLCQPLFLIFLRFFRGFSAFCEKRQKRNQKHRQKSSKRAKAVTQCHTARSAMSFVPKATETPSTPLGGPPQLCTPCGCLREGGLLRHRRE